MYDIPRIRRQRNVSALGMFLTEDLGDDVSVWDRCHTCEPVVLSLMSIDLGAIFFNGCFGAFEFRAAEVNTIK
jgi:hypothetical protein